MSGGEGVEYPSFVRYGVIQFGRRRRRRRRREGRVSTLRQSRDVAVHARHTGSHLDNSLTTAILSRHRTNGVS